MNELSEETRSKLKIGVILFLIAFIVIYGVFMYKKYSTPKVVGQEVNDSVIFTQPKFTFFSTEQTLKLYPDRITVHQPYLIIVKPDQWKSEVYNFQTKRKEKVINEVALDYVNNDIVYNKQGLETYFNKKSLKILCDRAFIKSSSEVLCVTRTDKDKPDNKLISINPQDLSQKELYRSQNVITALYYTKDTLYIGEYDFTTQKASLVVNNVRTPIKDLVNVIYPMNEKLYTGSFKSLRNNKTESYYEVSTNNKTLSTKLIESKRIVFHK